MKKLLGILIMLCVSFTYAQKERSLKLNKKTGLIEVVYYHDNGKISQTGFYTKEGKLQGEWYSYSQEGTKIVSAKYNKGKKVGKWFYWNGNTLREVDYSDNAIASVNEWTSTSSLASSN